MTQGTNNFRNIFKKINNYFTPYEMRQLHHRKVKPLATLKILDGPPNMIGQELNIYKDSVKLGRDPSVADLTFYGPDVKTSISRLHAKIERINGAWRHVALSQNHSETFIDKQSIPINEPVIIQNGQEVRFGYLHQKPVIFEFFVLTARVCLSTEKAEHDPERADQKLNEVEPE